MPVPDHCLIHGKINERTGIDGKPYAIGYEVRLPANWNGKFVFQGGGGVDGVLRLALGVIGSGTPQPNGLSAGYAVASTDAGHLEESGPIGPYLFGLDPQARRDLGYSSIPPVATAAKALIAKVYAKSPAKSYFVGCSNGGRQAMMATQRYPEMFDGAIAAAPAYRVPLAGIDAIGHTQAFMSVAPKGDDGKPDLGSALSKDELRLIADGILDACDAADGVKDGMVQNMAACKFDPGVLICKKDQSSACLPAAKVDVVKRVFAGTRNSKGTLIYSEWPYDPGIAAPGWAAWRIGTPRAVPPDARNVTLVPGSIAYDLMSPPEKPTDLLDWALNFDFDRDPPKVYKGKSEFEAGMEFVAATSTDLDDFKAKGGKIIFLHGTADPIFSPFDTIRYQEALQARYGSDTANFSRVFLVPGMNHCVGGPATDEFDALSALDAWIETGVAPDMILAKARKRPDVPWPGRTRPLCPFPKVSTYKGGGDIADAGNFECR
ncbi:MULTISPECIES: tannase/feruloyl esterase family alpha/beta hydrolase [unclassified Bradyrhizobium]|uniref:tannase/feruloyl esterase family alpha/beta hydrolase n=1 Tax=unclassified Bradyrhizobium TaxID=2631580 RepID=UPI002010F202|nr:MULTISPECIES: tannase/feruloyl esterase family alpha/beta hydrolase [unclassified Bradyrhizobium]